MSEAEFWNAARRIEDRLDMGGSTMDPIDEVCEWLDKQDANGFAVIEVRIVRALLEQIDANVKQPQQVSTFWPDAASGGPSEIDKQISSYPSQSGGFEPSENTGQAPQTAASHEQVSMEHDTSLQALAEDAEDMGAYEAPSTFAHNNENDVIVPKPCPFCGEPATAWPDDPNRDIQIWSVVCDGCDAEGPPAWHKEEAVEKWNRRTPTQKARIRQLEPLREES